MRFHHAGVACRNLDREQRVWEAVGYRPEGPDFTDPLQGVRGRFLVGDGPRLELLEPLPGADTLDPWIKGGSRMYHQAYETADLQAGIEQLGGRVVRPPTPAVAFGGREVCFVAMPSLMLIELIQSAGG